MHPFLTKLIGSWESVKAIGIYPTIKDFQYQDDLIFEEHGQPLLSYRSITSINSVTKHCESGFIRVNPQTNAAFSMEAHNFGLSVNNEGKIDGDKMELESTGISRMSISKEPHVTKIKKVIEFVSDNELKITTDMATTNTEMTNHLIVTYKRKNV